MHDCRTTESRLVDLVFGELSAGERRRLLAELDACADCLDEYRSMSGTLSAFDEAAEASLPDEAYWPGYRAALLRRLTPPAASAAPRRASFWKRALTARLPVPVPLAAALALALLALSVLALRPRPADLPPPSPQSQAATEANEPPQASPAPFIQERVVTRVVYVEKRRRERREGPRQAPKAVRDESPLAARPDAEKESGRGGFFTRANLTDFQPAGELKIRVIKRSNSDEK